MTEYHDGMRVEKEKSSAIPSTETGDELLPCPFCGSESVVYSEHFKRVRCNSCFAGCEPGNTREKATALWNKRTPAKEEMK